MEGDPGIDRRAGDRLLKRYYVLGNTNKKIV